MTEQDTLAGIISRLENYYREVKSLLVEQSRIEGDAAKLGLCPRCFARVLSGQPARRCCPPFDSNNPAAKAALADLGLRLERCYRERIRQAPTVLPIFEEAEDRLGLCAVCLHKIARGQPPEACCAGFDQAWASGPVEVGAFHVH